MIFKIWVDLLPIRFFNHNLHYGIHIKLLPQLDNPSILILKNHIELLLTLLLGLLDLQNDLLLKIL
jgi:hypothetical protein